MLLILSPPASLLIYIFADMNSSIDFSVATADLLATELDEILFESMSYGESIAVTFSVYWYVGMLDQWTNTYYADTRGSVTISDLAKMWNGYILSTVKAAGDLLPGNKIGGLTVTISYVYGQTSGQCNRRIWYSRRHDGATHALLKGKMPFLSKKKRIFADSSEMVYAQGPDNVTMSVAATYVRNNTQSVSAQTLTPTSNTFQRAADASPSVITGSLPNNSDLKEYTVTVGSDTCTYLIEQRHYAQRTLFCWLNRYGVWETLWFLGSELRKVEISSDFGWVGEEWKPLDVDVSDTFQAFSGYQDEKVFDQVRDMVDSPAVFILDKGVWKAVTIKDTDLSKKKPRNEAFSCSVTYRLSAKL